MRRRLGEKVLPAVIPLLLLLAVAASGRFLVAQEGTGTGRQTLPEGFVYLSELEPEIVIDLKYAGAGNFTGRPVTGYERGRCIITSRAAAALLAVHAELRRYGYGLKVFDAYRPQRAVNEFVRWTRTPGDHPALKARYYPDVKKSELMQQGYIAGQSGHSRGSCVDVTIVQLQGAGEVAANGPRELDMGTPFDYFGRASHSEARGITPRQRLHRLLLRSLMEKHGFEHLPEEWWHYVLRDEPYPDTYFDFPIN